MEHYGLQTAAGHLTVSAESKEPYAADVLEGLHADAELVIARYPQKRSALLPLLHLVQSVDGYVTGRGIDFCAEVLDLTRAEVSGVATFYTQYKRHPNGEYTVGVCTNTLCAVMGGDEIWESVSEHLGIGHDETTADGRITLERIECNAACDYAPVVMANWEFFDNQTPESTNQLVDDLREGTPVKPTRGPNTLCTFKQMSRVLAGFHDGLADEGVGAGPASLIGLEVAHENGWEAPSATPAPAQADAPATDSAPKTGDEHSSASKPGSAAATETTPTQADDKAAGDKAAGDKAAGDKAADEKAAGDKAADEKPSDEKDEKADEAQPATLFDDGASTAEAEPKGDAPLTGTPASGASQGAPTQTGGRAPEGFKTSSFGDGSVDADGTGIGPDGWDIKGNANSMLFHTPESPWYARTKAEVWFRDEDAATAAGFTNALDRNKKDES
ncbi:NADH dehydrogenase subunit E [Knoellia subterranea KCTC 19937]|uniref:NADH dehydrogenase subunit E n=1 Tax=Knoellia subterranea KCTC 19937 TaxID=1385521 RepID=A0A0A0JM64_9MICO|nr:NADH-quinone oxidoreductase subunit NuoE [Knoellia subterranea]KGN38228.1 NADH dehydrogenase subunit E [Knoellia subterranea KCTC 19937]